MAHGVPAVVSTQGASGLEDLAGHAILVADDARTFAAQIKTLAGSLPLRQAMSSTAHDHVARHFGIDRCFGELARQIEGLATQ
jgi:glycosyltransferase involved in cell wall biosynthesis